MIQATFDGKVFVPAQPVDLPPGTKVNVVVPVKLPSNPPRKMTPEEEQEWQEVLKQIQASEPPFTFEEHLRFRRGGK